MWIILKAFIEVVTILLQFYVFGFFGCKARGILAPPTSPALEGNFLITGLPGKFLFVDFLMMAILTGMR